LVKSHPTCEQRHEGAAQGGQQDSGHQRGELEDVAAGRIPPDDVFEVLVDLQVCFPESDSLVHHDQVVQRRRHENDGDDVKNL